MIRFTKLNDTMYISNRQNNGEFDYWLVLTLVVWAEAVGDREAEEIGATYNLTLCVVSPQQAGEDNVEQAMDGWDQETPTEEQKAAALAEYGVYAQVWNKNGNNLRALLQEGHKEAGLVQMLFGFYMDRRVNQIGTTGWEALKGDYDSAIKRAPGIEGRIMRKISGVPEPVSL